MPTVFDETNPERLTLVDILRLRAQHSPQREAYTFLPNGEMKQVQMTYADLDREARRIAALLQDRVAPGERVLLLYPPGLEYVAAIFGCFYAGVVAVPAYPPRLNQSLMRVQTILRDAEATAVLTTSTILSSMRRTKTLDPWGKPKGRIGASPIRNQDLQWIATDTVDPQAVASYRESGREGKGLAPFPSLQAPALLRYTSGSTGSPKGVMLTHNNLMRNAALIQEGMSLTIETRALFWLPPYHDMGLMGGILQGLYTGYPTVLMTPVTFLQQPLRWLQAISSFQATVSGAPNFAYDLCAKKATAGTLKALNLRSWAVAFNGAEPVRAETLQRFAETFAPCGFRPEMFYPCYGMAEATLFLSGGRQDEKPSIRTFDGEAIENGYAVETTGEQESSRLLVSCGYVRQGQEVAIVDPQLHTRCAPGTIGEIWVRGPNVAPGYWGKAEETAETFQAFLRENVNTGEASSPECPNGPFLRTGDLGFCRDNELFVTGRLKDLIIIRGRNLYPHDIEQVVEKSHPLLRQSCCAAFAIEGASSEQVVIVQEVVRHYDDQGIQEAIQAICQAVLSEFDVEVGAIELLRVGTIPKTTSGKIQRHACRSGFLAGELNAVYRWKRISPQYPSNKEKMPENRVGTGKGQAAFPTAPVPTRFSLTIQEIVDWLVMRIAERAHMDAHAVDLHAPFVQFGLNSLEAVGLSGELEQWLEQTLSPTLIYDYPSIDALARYLAGRREGFYAPPLPWSSARRRGIKPLPTALARPDAIAIIGLGCRFPGADNPEAFWQVLHDGVDAISLVPATRWDTAQFYAPDQAIPGKMNTRRGGFLSHIELFDPSFFHISPREARHMDPQQRLLLEVAWETLENPMGRDLRTVDPLRSSLPLQDSCFTANTGRTHFAHRLAVYAENTQKMREHLAAFVAGQPPKEVQVGHVEVGKGQAPALAFLFTGQGSQYAHMAHQLYKTQPTFRQALDECDRLLSLRTADPLSLQAVLYPTSGVISPIDETEYTQLALFALEYALAQMWLSWGITPNVVMGHSVGEYVAACVAGAFSLEDGLQLITARGRLMQALPERGTMAVIFAEPERVQSFVAPYSDRQVSLAALNGPENTVISGREEAIQLVTQRLEASAVRTHILPVSHAFHSPLVDPMLDAFEQVAREVAFAPLRLPLVCNLTGQLINVGEILDAHYWRRQTRESVQFATGIRTLAAHGYELFLELGPTPMLSSMGKRCLPDKKATWLSSLQRDQDDWHTLLHSLASLYCHGFDPNWSGFACDERAHKVALPTYPFEREYCWFKSEETLWEEDTSSPKYLPVKNVALGSKGKPLIDFGLIFFSSNEADGGGEDYQLVMESAKYADQHGFSSIWIPERHFTKDGWLYPNPAVLQAALARETSRIHLRAGSIVVPLHHPLRIAEEWAMVDKLSGGRVGVSFAAGWHPNDFALAPENYADRSEVMYRNIEIVRKLWRGETVAFAGSDGQLVDLKTYPSPMQHDIPIWLTAAGNPQTFVNAGKLGTNLLTHMYNQSVDELAEKIRLYRDARAENGYDPATGKVSVMLHTYIGADMETVRAQVQGPFSHYLQSASYLVNAIAYSRGQQADLSTLSEEDRQEYLVFVTDRLIREQRVLFGTPETCAPFVTQLQAAGVDEIACQMDFGIDADLVLRSLPFLNQLRVQYNGTSWTRRGQDPVQEIASNVDRTPPVGTGSAVACGLAPQVCTIPTTPVRVPTGTQNEINKWLYQLRWEVIDLPSPSPSIQPGHWLIFPDKKGVGQRLAQQLQEQGHSYSLITVGECFLTIDHHHYQVNPANSQEIKQAVGTALAAVRPSGPVGSGLAPDRWLRLRGVIHLWSLDTTPVAATNSTRLLADQVLGVQSALSLIQALVEESQQTRLWLITQGTQPVEATDTDLAVSQAPIWGLGKTCALEHPEIWGGLIDLDPGTGSALGPLLDPSTPPTPTGLILRVLQGDWREDQIALRGTNAYVARVVRVGVGLASTLQEPQPHTSRQIVSDATYLITGGLWGMGLACARWLAMQGARHLILLGRSKLPPRETWEQVLPESRQGMQIAGIRAIEQLGAHIHAASVDIADESQLATFFEQYQQQEKPPIRGIIHAASVWQDAQGQSLVRSLVNLKAEDLLAVLRPKMLGGWLLSNLLKGIPLDFFVSFSSAATLFGSAAQGNYAAASEFLDVLAHYQRAHGQPAVTIDWGAISEIGYGATPEGLRVHEYWESHGIGRLSPQQVLAALGCLLQGDMTRVGVARFDWSLLQQFYPQMTTQPLVSLLVGARPTYAANAPISNEGSVGNNETKILQTLRKAHEEVHPVIWQQVPYSDSRSCAWISRSMSYSLPCIIVSLMAGPCVSWSTR
jgi:natural product biosynthesis luciferase-like monooxygenase protein